MGQHLKGTMDEGLIMKPMSEDSFEMDVCVDSDFLCLSNGTKQSNLPWTSTSSNQRWKNHYAIANCHASIWSFASFVEPT